jgi:hypothetical protein
MITKATAFAVSAVDFKIQYRFETAQLLAQTAPCTMIFINTGNLPAPEFMFLTDSRLKQQVQVSSINITVCQHRISG